MYFALMGKLSARRQNLTEDKDKGFTLIELLVVVIIIGILAAIAIPVYLGVQNNAKESGVKSDLTNAKVAVIAVQTSTGTLPTAGVLNPEGTSAQDVALKAAGLTKGTDTNTITLSTTSTGGFCIVSGRSGAGNTTFATSESKGVDKGSCASGVFSTTAGTTTAPAA
ncbi:prepilin-type N-terminal cleavage/methylation domain-containing protein [Frigoribacterium sp. ACAM 257]|uniref:type II secretion system protein n=1 Tax=Frigoribacterium sp. ACAM 257 TaxID=2508998 RepID=UPI0011B9E78D|nr:prepilin-type N-terminal cleavage/methylation domain-containing protein [Frigoribacterium sp. ACAM 257]